MEYLPNTVNGWNARGTEVQRPRSEATSIDLIRLSPT